MMMMLQRVRTPLPLPLLHRLPLLSLFLLSVAFLLLCSGTSSAFVLQRHHPSQSFLIIISRHHDKSTSNSNNVAVTPLQQKTLKLNKNVPSLRSTSTENEQPVSIDNSSSPTVGEEDSLIRFEACAISGISSETERNRILNAISNVCEEYGIAFSVNINNNDDSNSCNTEEEENVSSKIPGALGRALLIHVHGLPHDADNDNDNGDIEEHELVAQLKYEMMQRIDAILYEHENENEGFNNNQPILLAFRAEGDISSIADVIEKEIADYGLRDAVCSSPVDAQEDDGNSASEIDNNNLFIPSIHIEIDGAMVTSTTTGERYFDKSSCLVFDNLLDDSLRQRLLNVVKGYPEDHSHTEDDWNDVEDGPDPNRWIRGGLMDVVDETTTDTGDNNDNDNNNNDGPCWGLTNEAIMDICYNDHPAIRDFEARLTRLFPNFIVSRLPESVLGECVSPLTANAPTHGDTFEYHIDADPLQVPPSPWADVYGRYPNRMDGKPRFVSCLLYLNDEWNSEEEWGAPTRFLDPPTQQVYNVYPKPGRCVFMDQDISHTVVAPNAEAGRNRPRYSLVWKLILHPKVVGQDMDLSCGRRGGEEDWPEVVVIGSANNDIG